MNAVATYVDLTLTALVSICIIANCVIFHRMFLIRNVYRNIDHVLNVTKIWLGSFSKLTAFSWSSITVIYGGLFHYGQFVFIAFSLMMVIGFCVFYLVMDFVRPVEI